MEYDRSSCAFLTLLKQPPQDSQGDCILLAVPKKGRLYERVVQLLNGAGLDFVRTHRLDIAPCTRTPVTVVFLPAADIAHYVGEGNVDIGGVMGEAAWACMILLCGFREDGGGQGLTGRGIGVTLYLCTSDDCKTTIGMLL